MADRSRVRLTSRRPMSVSYERCRLLEVSPLAAAARMMHEHVTKAAGHGAEQSCPCPARAGRLGLARRSLPRAARKRHARALRQGACAERGDVEPHDLRQRRAQRRPLPRPARGARRPGAARAARCCSSPSRWPTSTTPLASCTTRTSAAAAVTTLRLLRVHPDVAHDAIATVRQARHVTERVEAPNVMIKVPATDAASRRSRS